MKKYFVYQGNKTWINVLPKIIFSYNHSPHRGLKGQTPADFTKNQPKLEKINKPKYKVGDHVRISKINSSPFIKNFDNNWSDEVYQIFKIDTKQNPVMYVIVDHENKPITGKFYEQELQVIPAPTIFRIQKILKTKKDGKYKQYYVKWHGYETPSWISENQLIK